MGAVLPSRPGDRSLEYSLTSFLGQASASTPEQQDLSTFKSGNSNDCFGKWLWPLQWPGLRTDKGEMLATHTPSGLGGWSKEAASNPFLGISSAVLKQPLTKDSNPKLGQGDVSSCCASWWPLTGSTAAQNSEVTVRHTQQGGCYRACRLPSSQSSPTLL